MTQYFEPLQNVRKREWCYSRAKENHRMQEMDLCLGVFVIHWCPCMDVCSQHKMEEKVTNSNLKISLQCFVVLKFSVCFQSS